MYLNVLKLSKQYPTSEYEVKMYVIQKGKYFIDNLNFI